MKPLILLVALVGLGATALTIVLGARVMEPTVVEKPYEEGLRYDEQRRKAAATPTPTPTSTSTSTATGTGTGTATGDLSLEVSPQPLRAMTELTFTVRAPQGATDVSIALTMPGMYMGENRVALKPAGGGFYRGTGTIVRCPSGSRAWAADVTARTAAGTLSRRFDLEVADR